MAPEPRGDGGRGRGLWRKDPSPCDPLQKRGGIPNFNTVAALRFPAPFRGRQSRRFLETGSLHPPLAALRLFPPHPLETTQRGGAAAPPLWIPLPGMDGGARSEAGSAERGAEPMRQPPRKDAPKAPNAGNTFPVPGRKSAPGGNMASFCRMDSHDPRF